MENEEYIKRKNANNPTQKVVQKNEPSNLKSITLKESSQENKIVNQQKSTSK